LEDIKGFLCDGNILYTSVLMLQRNGMDAVKIVSWSYFWFFLVSLWSVREAQN